MAAARDVGCTRAVVLGSYYTFVHRQRPGLRLADRHPYVASRVEQAAAARQAAGDRLPVAVLEIPFVFGSVPGRRTLWAPLVPWLRSRYPLFAAPGGTAAVPVRAVAQATAGALETAAGDDYPLGAFIIDDNEFMHAQNVRRLIAGSSRDCKEDETCEQPELSAPCTDGSPHDWHEASAGLVRPR